MNAENFLSRLDKVKRIARGWIACCPAHDDTSPSLTVSESANGGLLVHCFGGCEVESVVGSLGLRMFDLMPDSERGVDQSRPSRMPASDALEALSFNATIVVIAALDMAKGKTLSDADKDALFRAATSINDGVNLTRRKQ